MFKNKVRSGVELDGRALVVHMAETRFQAPLIPTKLSVKKPETLDLDTATSLVTLHPSKKTLNQV